MLERSFSDKVIRKLRSEVPGLWRKQPVSRFGQSGVADIQGCVRGRYIEIELKSPGRYSDPYMGLTPLQLHHGHEVLDNGGIWLVGDSWPSIKTALNLKLLAK